MKILEQVEVQLSWSDLDNLTYHPRNESARSEGLHVSSILRNIAIKGNLYTNEDQSDDMPLRIMLGLAFEEMAARLYPGMSWQPGELSYEGMAGSPDGLSRITVAVNGLNIALDDVVDSLCVDEFKYTGKSMRRKGAKPQADGTFLQEDLKDICAEWLWMQQVMAYINLYRRLGEIMMVTRMPVDGVQFTRAVEYRKMNLGRFHICWKFGTYTFPQGEVYMRYLVEFTEAELRGNWAMLRAFKP